MADFTINYPGTDGALVEQIVSSGQFLFMVGANGTGKSTLMHQFANQNRGHIRRITAHRQVWFNSDSVDITPMGRQQTEQNISSSDRQAQSRWKDDHAPQRAQAIIFDIIDSENVDARKIADAARANNMEAVQQLATEQSPLKKLNDILKVANLGYQVAVSEGSKLVAVKEGYENYSIAELSDGERNALLIAANVLTAPRETLILLDEPERHLHRSIVSPLLSTLLTYRDDCAFVISTHDVLLPLDQKEAATLLIRAYSHAPQQHWLVDRIDAVQDLDEDIAAAILGSRRKLLFIEGDAESLDIQLYHLIFPDISTHPVGSCVDVERNVRGLRATANMHWVSAFGIIDKDQRSDEDCGILLNHGIAAIQQYSVESIYYNPQVINLVLARIEGTHGIDSQTAQREYQTGTLEAINEHKLRLAARLAEKAIRDKILKDLPDWRSILEGNTQLEFSTQEILDAENALIEQLLQGENVEQLMSRYPIRETQIPNIVARALGFQSPSKYEQAVRKALIDSEEAKQIVVALLQPVADIIAA
ncbi:MAG: ATP-binding protein [Candidatus Thiodiazotropha sp. (ex Myrtea spinifera)]|nr:ATP-binding protein [Candidatus Thiodiazotropha sp. (ex Myrtea spinifera)]